MNLRNKNIDDYLKNNILKSYLIHIEFEIENVLMKLKTDKLLIRLIKEKGFVNDLYHYKTNISLSLTAIRELIKIHEVDY